MYNLYFIMSALNIIIYLLLRVGGILKWNKLGFLANGVGVRGLIYSLIILIILI